MSEVEEIAPLVDVAGNTIAVGDWVIYPQMSGRSVQIVLGKLVSWNGKTAQIERIEGGRWSPGYAGSVRYRDKRTGKGIDPYMTQKHWDVVLHHTYKHRETGEEISQEEIDSRHPVPNYWGGYNTYHAALVARQQYETIRHQGVLKDYVEEYKSALKPVTIQNVENIVKVVPAEVSE